MAVSLLPTPRALMLDPSYMKIRLHGKKLAIYPDWRIVEKTVTVSHSGKWGKLSWGGSETMTVTYIDPFETAPDGSGWSDPVPRTIPLPPVYVLNMSNTDGDFDTVLKLCEDNFGVSFFVSKEVERCAWAYVYGKGLSESEQIIPGCSCCSYLVDESAGDDDAYNAFGKCVCAVAVSGQIKYDFVEGGDGTGIFTTPFSHILEDVPVPSCEGIRLYNMEGSPIDFPGLFSYRSSPPVGVLYEVRAINPTMPTLVQTRQALVGSMRRFSHEFESSQSENSSITQDEVLGVFKGVEGAPFTM